MNVFFIIGDTAYTPGLESGTILSGVTRESVITLLKEAGLKVAECDVNIDDIVNAYRENNLLEVFGTGTAATISMIKELRYRDIVMNFSVDQWKIAPQVKQRMNDIKEGISADKYNWMVKI